MRIVVGLGCLTLMTLAASPNSAAAPAPTLCRADELVVFSCATGMRIASICASRNISKGGGYMQYRYGRKDGLDMIYPDVATHPADIFTSGTMIFSGGGGAWLRFSKGPYVYTIFTAIGKWGPGESAADASGVAVQKDGKELANFPCRAGGANGELGPDFFDRLGLKTADQSDDFEIPQAFMPK